MNMWHPALADYVSHRHQRFYCSVEVLVLHQDVVGVVRGHGEDPDAAVREHARDFRQDADEREVEDSLDAEALPAVFALECLGWCIARQAHKRDFLVRLADEEEIAVQIDVSHRRDLANGQLVWQLFQFHGNPFVMLRGLLALYDVDMIVIKRGQCVAWSYSDDATRLTVRTAEGEKHGC